MGKKIAVALIGAVATITGSVIGAYVGKNMEQRSIQNEMNEVIGNVINIDGNDNEVTINDLKDLIEDYENLKKQNTSLVSQNAKYFDELEDVNNKMKDLDDQSSSKVEELENQLNDMPIVQFKSLGLSINGEDIPINADNSSVIVNNRTYYAEEFINNIVSSDMNISVQNNTMYIGKIIYEKTMLFDEWLFDHRYDNFENIAIDSYGKNHTNVVTFTNQGYVTFNLNNNYSLFKCNIAIQERYGDGSSTGNVIIKADDQEVYRSPDISKMTKAYDIIDIPIYNCSLLTIQYVATGSTRCIVSEAIAYN